MDYGSSRNLSMTADDKVSVSGAYHGIASEQNTTGDISIKAGSMDIASPNGYGIFMNGANKVEIDASDGFTLKGGHGISNNGSEAITIRSDNGDTNIQATSRHGATAGSGDINITAKNNTVEVKGADPGPYGGIRSGRGNINVTATVGNNTIKTGENVSGIVSYLDKRRMRLCGLRRGITSLRQVLMVLILRLVILPLQPIMPI